ncbi:hypothetical protein B0H13DRAFT_2495988 [Mycena leptocephala]|nr:hypothetical protein B0H13DRAFT_2495988 [Mycena leptocephala]
MFKTNLLKLKDLRCESANVPGEVQCAVDAWQADNLDAYFVATGSETYRDARVCLLAKCTQRCLAHIINLATLQAVIKTCSKLKCYDPHAPEEHVPDLTESHRDVLVSFARLRSKWNSYSHQERSSAKRKELFRSLQKKAGSKTVLQLILDMIIWWSSTYAMLHRGYTLREFVDAFVLKIAREGKDPVKSEKPHFLLLFESEWALYADAAQQAFSCDVGPSMRLAIPALESLHRG